MIFDYFTDAVLRGPTIGSMLMCLGASLMGVIILLRKESLLGETLSHAAYPGVIVGALLTGLLSKESSITFFVMAGATIASLIGLWAVHLMQKKQRVSSDAALTFVLASFFGMGILLASRIQFLFPGLYRQSLTYLYGQAATMVDFHIYLYGVLSLVVILFLFLFYKELQTVTFDRDYAKSLGLNTPFIDNLIFILVVLAVVIGIRSVGVVLMSAMLIAPAVAARQYTHKLSTMLLIAGFIGPLSGFLGVYGSVEWTGYPLPTGPMIVLVATSICVVSLLLAPERGLLVRLFRIIRFRYRCIGENVLKAIWRLGPQGVVDGAQLSVQQHVSRPYLELVLRHLAYNGWLVKPKPNHYALSHEGASRAAHIVRLHRLWELYLADYLGVGADRVHRSAEEMEHILTPEIEAELTRLLHNPTRDPHQQPIPKGDV